LEDFDGAEPTLNVGSRENLIDSKNGAVACYCSDKEDASMHDSIFFK
jgi:hypothetical protein